MNFQDYEVILHVFEAMEKKKADEVRECFTGNFKSVILNEEVSVTQYLDVYNRIKEGMPDAKFTITDLTSNGDSFKANVKITGTHTHEFPPFKKGWRKLKPTGKKVSKTITAVEILLKGNRILEIKNLNSGNGVVAGMLDELHLLPKSYHCN